MTNADKYFRNATNDQLAAFLINFLCATCGSGAIAREMVCRGKVEAWLNQETSDLNPEIPTSDHTQH